MAATTSPAESFHLSALTIHGGRLDEAVRRFPQATLPWLDLSTGINPCAYPTSCAEGVDHVALPSRSALARLETTAARAFGMRSCAIAALPGSEIGLRLLDTLALPAPAAVVRPAYGTHAAALPGAAGVTLDDLKQARTVLLANPNNPDGRLIALDRLLAMARALALRGGWLVVDEAFADAHPDASILPLLREGDPVLVLRSFGKFYGLAGIRLGFVCGPEAMVDRLRRRLGHWPVSSAAIAIGTAAYCDTAWREATRDRLVAAAGALDAVLHRHGLPPHGASPLFRLVDTPDAAALFEHLAQRGILTRPFDYAPTWLRVGLPADAAALRRLDRALDDR